MLKTRRPIWLIAPGMTLALAGIVMLLVVTGLSRASDAGPPAQDRYLVVDRAEPEILAGLTAVIRALPGVTSAVEVRVGVRWLQAWTPAGMGRLTTVSGYFVPVEVAAVDPDQYAELLPDESELSAHDLAAGKAILSSSSARLRSMPDGGTLEFTTGIMEVAGSVDDRWALDHEVVVARAVGESLGLRNPRYIAVTLGPGADPSQIESAVRAAAPPGPENEGARVRGSEGTGLASLGNLLSMARLKLELGEFPARPAGGRMIKIEPGWIDTNTVRVTVPLLNDEFRCHKLVVPQIEAAMSEIQHNNWSVLIDGSDFGGCFSPRFISSSPDSGLSRHAWGAAFDLNVHSNLYGDPPAIDPRVVDIVESHGFNWGGRWDVPDGMHFEFVGASRQ